jgi:hypothetical protein
MLARESALAVINERLRHAEGERLAAHARATRADELLGLDQVESRPQAVQAAVAAMVVLLLGVVALVATAFA